MADIAEVFDKALDSGYHADDQVVKVYFAPEGQTWTENGITYTADGWSDEEKARAMASLQTYSNIIDLTFVETTDRSDYDFYLTTRELDEDRIGYFNYLAGHPEAGIGGFDNQWRGWSDDGLTPGGYGFYVFLHEFGHGLGLSHPHKDYPSDYAFPGVYYDEYDRGDNDLNQGVYTVMSYISGWETHPSPEDNLVKSAYGHAMTPMAFDIAVLQEIYGANTTYASGDNTYTLPDVNEAGTGYTAIWDTGGTDTIVNPGSRTAIIDLRPATLQNEEGGGGWMSYADGIEGGFTIANGVVIENAIGGGGPDIIIGNEGDNDLQGGGGNDDLWGEGGADRLLSLSGVNYLFGGDSSDLVVGGIQADGLDGGSGNDVIRGEAGNGFLGGSDIIMGGTGNDTMMGGRGADVFIFRTNDGDDVIGQFGLGDVAFDDVNGYSVAANGADFQSGVDHIELIGFSTVDASNVMDSVTDGEDGAVFSAEGASITFYGVAADQLTADDFIFS